MQTKAKVNSLVTHRFVDDSTLGFTVQGLPELLFDTSKAAHDNKVRAMFHGWIQRVTDMAAVPVADKDGNIVPLTRRLEMKRERMNAVISHFESGALTWNMRTAASLGARGGVSNELVIRAIAELRNIDVTAANGLVDKWASSKAVSRSVVLESFAARQDVSDLMRGYRAEAVKGIDTDELMEGLGE